MKLATFDGTPFAESLRSLLGSLLAGHPDSQAILDSVTAGRLRLRIVIDQAANVVTIGATTEAGEQRLLATVDMAAGSAAWRVLYADQQAPPPELDAVLH
ncbi:MAG TPA: hypothetical protein VMP67_06170 [Candidatus Limnocylindria bacterium]|nr:hypothetical protein [Candidatus Limnocylindria bacterium]